MKTQELNIDELKQVNGGSVLNGNGLDLGGIMQGTAGLSSSSMGMNGNHTYETTDSHMAEFGLGDMLSSMSF